MKETLVPPEERVEKAPRRLLPLRGKDILLSVAFGLGVLAAAYFIMVPGGIEGQSQPLSLSGVALGPVPTVGEPAPNIQVMGLDGEMWRISDFRGQAVWLNFWATWCPPCRAENPDIEAIYQEFKAQGLVVLALSVAESPATVREYAERVGLSYTIGLDSNRFAAARYRVVGLPTHIFIDRQGVIRAYRIGALSEKSMRAMVEEVLREP
ncbi:MAG: TlpA family protein disulfide reductase [Chloroflexi bacterium]|nr:TlpA family protein disulfide reductase [Chloroflexota bacterium]